MKKFEQVGWEGDHHGSNHRCPACKATAIANRSDRAKQLEMQHLRDGILKLETKILDALELLGDLDTRLKKLGG